jgi:acyl-lipid omega-6 desaturase (Delta-12 desaturase)
METPIKDIRLPASKRPGQSLAPSDTMGAAHVGIALLLGVLSVFLGQAAVWWQWLLGQLLFALSFLQWFVLLHEAGHLTLFRSRSLNWIAGYVAAFLALIPFTAWRHVHARHHRWTGWQDLDATTESLVPRPLAAWEQRAINFAWRTGLPVFSLIYRVQNYWNVWRLRRFLSERVLHRMRVENALYLAPYIALIAWVGPATILATCGLGLFLGLVVQDPLLLSQHTHIPQRLAANARARPFSAFEQQAFTRSLRLPAWLSWLILHFDAHELHHMYVRVPGYRLRNIAYRPSNEQNWWTWLRVVKKMPGCVFLFSNRDKTGVRC